MNTHRCLKIAARIDALLEQQIGLGVDAKRMLTERLYLRDVLLVCDAHRGSELAELATWFRRSAAERPVVGRSSPTREPDSGFSSSGYPLSGFDGRAEAVPPLSGAAVQIRLQLDQQRAAARHSGWLSALRATARA